MINFMDKFYDEILWYDFMDVVDDGGWYDVRWCWFFMMMDDEDDEWYDDVRW